MEKEKIFVLVGPTASGKTEAAIGVAERINNVRKRNAVEIVSADSIQIYRGLDIGSAKPNADEMNGIPHHLLDFVDYSDPSFNVAMYRRTATDVIHSINERNGIPIVVGGTGLYINSLVYPLNFSEAKPNFQRREVLAKLEEDSPGSLHRMLSEIDAETSARLHPNDIKRIIRAIEVYEQTGQTLSDAGGDFSNERGKDIEFFPIMAGLKMDRKLLYERIEKRIDIMLESGLIKEVENLLASNPNRSLPALQGLGYKQLIMYLDGKYTLDEAINLIKRDTRRFAKRQISWFKRDKRIRWFDSEEYSSKDELVDAIFEYYLNVGEIKNV